MTKPYQYKVKRPHNPQVTIGKAAELEKPEEMLTGFVDGQSASDFEERFAIALAFEGIPYEFQQSFMAKRNMPGEIRPDFVVYVGGLMQPVQIDGDFAHKDSAQREEDEMKDDLLNENLREENALPTLRIREGEEDLSSIESCRDIVRMYFA